MVRIEGLTLKAALFFFFFFLFEMRFQRALEVIEGT